MSLIKLHDRCFRPFINRQQIAERVNSLGAEITKDYHGLDPLFISILNGSFIFAADLFREVKTHAEIAFVKLSSYSGMASSGTVITEIGIPGDITGRHIVIVEDIIDTGRTLAAFIPELLKENPASVKLACFLSKPEALQHDIKADYTCFEIQNEFVVGYGLDYDGLGRNLPDLYILADQ